MATVLGAITWYLNQIRKDRPDPVINPAWPTIMVTLVSPQLADHCSCPGAGAAVYSWRRIRLCAGRSGNSIAVANSTRFAARERIDVAMVTSVRKFVAFLARIQ